jgi:hypothetical protein
VPVSSLPSPKTEPHDFGRAAILPATSCRCYDGQSVVASRFCEEEARASIALLVRRRASTYGSGCFLLVAVRPVHSSWRVGVCCVCHAYILLASPPLVIKLALLFEPVVPLPNHLLLGVLGDE